MTRAAQGDLGVSLRSNRPVATLIRERLPATVELTLAALLIAVAIAVPAGIVSAVQRGSRVDRVAMVGAVAGQAMPIFWLALLLIMPCSACACAGCPSSAPARSPTSCCPR